MALTDGYLVKVDGAASGTKQRMADAGSIVTEIGATGSDTAFPTEQAVREALSQFQVRNLIINGDMRRGQRGTSFAAIASNAYCLDRWEYHEVGSAVHTITQVNKTAASANTPSDQFEYAMKLDCTTADASVDAGDLVYMTQRIEGYNFRKCVGQTATLSFWVKAGKTGTMCVAFMSGGHDISYVAEITIDVANTWERKEITLNFDYSSGTWSYDNGEGLLIALVLMAGSTYQTTANSWQTGSWLVATSNQTNFCDATDSTCDVYFTGVQLELGATATDFDFEDESVHLERCQRYYEKSYEMSVVPGTIDNEGRTISRVAGSEGTYYSLHTRFKTRKRAVPSVTWYNPITGNSAEFELNGTAKTVTGTFQPSESTPGVPTASGGGTVNQRISTHWVADAEL